MHRHTASVKGVSQGDKSGNERRRPGRSDCPIGNMPIGEQLRWGKSQLASRSGGHRNLQRRAKSEKRETDGKRSNDIIPCRKAPSRLGPIAKAMLDRRRRMVRFPIVRVAAY